MRTIAALTVLVATVAAEETASELFYRAFWLEQAAGKAKVAEELYLGIVERFPESAEAPRALLGAIRIRVGRGRPVDPIVEKLERDYPEAKQEIEQARGLAKTLTREFDALVRKDDPPAVRKLKTLYGRLRDRSAAELSEAETNFLIDLGVAAHGMLRRLLRDNDADGNVYAAATILVRQRTPEAFRVLADALGDRRVLFRGTIVSVLQFQKPDAPELAPALDELFQASAPRLRKEVASAAVGMIARTERNARLYVTLARAVRDEDAPVRAAAATYFRDHLRRVDFVRIPDDTARALLERIEARDPLFERFIYWLPYFGDRPALAPRIEQLMVARGPMRLVNAPAASEAGAQLVRRVVGKLLDQGATGEVYAIAQAAAQWSPAASVTLVETALKRDDEVLATRCLRQDLSEEARAALRVKALAVLFERPDAAGPVLQVVGLHAQDLRAVLEVLEKNQGRGVPGVLRQRKFVMAIGPENAAKLVPYCKQEELDDLAKATGWDASEGKPFFEAWIAAAGPLHVKRLRVLARHEELRPVVARKLLKATGEEWGWDVERRRGSARILDESHGPLLWDGVRDACARPPLDRIVLDHARDPRWLVAQTAVEVARSRESDAATKALHAALRSPHDFVRAQALPALASRGEAGVDALRGFVRRKELTGADRNAVLQAIEAAGTKAVSICEELLATREPFWDGGWYSYDRIAPGKAFERALGEAVGDAPRGFRDGALRILTKHEDPRRLDVFRSILDGKVEGDVGLVLRTVGSQYVIELSDETLRHLRNPDPRIRNAAHEAVKKLKFYAEARKAFK